MTLLALAAYVLAGCGSPPSMQDMGEMPMSVPQASDDFAPLVQGYFDGGEVFFIHTEASVEGVADMLTEMMGPQVVLVPSLANAPDEIVAGVYVFMNGVPGMGPFGFQPDVFDSVPGMDSYSPLRTVNLVTWEGDAQGRELTSVPEILAARDAGELVVELTDYIVNMPILVWPGGHR